MRVLTGCKPAPQLAELARANPPPYPFPPWRRELGGASAHDVPVARWVHQAAPNHVPVHSLISPNAQVRGLKQPRCSKTQRAHGLKQLWRCAGGIFYLSCEECSLFSPP